MSLPRVGNDAGDWVLKLEPLFLAVEAEIPQLQLGLVRKVGIDGTGPGTRNQKRLCRARGPGEGRRPRDLSQPDHCWDQEAGWGGVGWRREYRVSK